MKNPQEFVLKKGVLAQYRGKGGQVAVPKGVKAIGKKAFLNCRELTRVSLPVGVKQVGDKAFRGCASLTRVELPQGVRRIGNDAFSSCSSLFGLEIPPGAKKIGRRAFADCASLTRLVIPTSVKKLKGSAFQGCPMSAAVPYLPVKEFKKRDRPQAAQHFAAARLTKLHMRRGIQAGYLKYIRRHRKQLYPAAIESEELLWLMLEENMVPQKELRLLLKEAERQQKWDAKAAILAYGRDKEQKPGAQKAGRKGKKK